MLGRKTLISALLAVVALGGGAAAGYKYWRNAEVAGQPTPATAVVVNGPPTPGQDLAPTALPTAPPTPLPTSVFVQVPYTAQSPYNQWGTNNPHEEYCEAAALLMVSDYFKGDKRSRIPPAEADSSMAQIVGVERRSFPGTLDLPLESIGSVGNQMFSLQPTVMPVDLEQIRSNLAQGRPVIIPVMTHGANGAKIAPFYGAVNVYHVIVLTGYDTAKGLLYTNDAGFVQGQNYAYSWDTLSSAIDAQATKFPQGRVMLVFSAG